MTIYKDMVEIIFFLNRETATLFNYLGNTEQQLSNEFMWPARAMINLKTANVSHFLTLFH